jgi:hypothetical protein
MYHCTGVRRVSRGAKGDSIPHHPLQIRQLPRLCNQRGAIVPYRVLAGTSDTRFSRAAFAKKPQCCDMTDTIERTRWHAIRPKRRPSRKREVAAGYARTPPMDGPVAADADAKRHTTKRRPAWCERRDSNPHGDYPLEPKSSASTSSATFANLALRNRSTPEDVAGRRSIPEESARTDRPRCNGTSTASHLPASARHQAT